MQPYGFSESKYPWLFHPWEGCWGGHSFTQTFKKQNMKKIRHYLAVVRVDYIMHLYMVTGKTKKQARRKLLKNTGVRNLHKSKTIKLERVKPEGKGIMHIWTQHNDEYKVPNVNAVHTPRGEKGEGLPLG